MRVYYTSNFFTPRGSYKYRFVIAETVGKDGERINIKTVGGIKCGIKDGKLSLVPIEVGIHESVSSVLTREEFIKSYTQYFGGNLFNIERNIIRLSFKYGISDDYYESIKEFERLV